MTALPEEILGKSDELRSFRAEYKLQSVKGDVLCPYLARTGDDTYVVTLQDTEERTRLVVEFTI